MTFHLFENTQRAAGVSTRPRRDAEGGATPPPENG